MSQKKKYNYDITLHYVWLLILYSKFWTQLKDKPILTLRLKKLFYFLQQHISVNKGFQVLLWSRLKQGTTWISSITCVILYQHNAQLRETLAHKMKQFHSTPWANILGFATHLPNYGISLVPFSWNLIFQFFSLLKVFIL